MVSGVNSDAKRNASTHTRSVSYGGAGSSSAAYSNSADLRQSNTSGKRLSDGIKRRFGSIRRKKSQEQAY